MKVLAAALLVLALGSLQRAEATPMTFSGVTMLLRWAYGANNLVMQTITVGPGVEAANFAGLFRIDVSTANTINITFNETVTFSPFYALYFDLAPWDDRHKRTITGATVLPGTSHPVDDFVWDAPCACELQLLFYGDPGSPTWEPGDQILLDVSLDGQEVVVPEPSSLLLLSGGLVGLGILRRRITAQ